MADRIESTWSQVNERSVRTRSSRVASRSISSFDKTNSFLQDESSANKVDVVRKEKDEPKTKKKGSIAMQPQTQEDGVVTHTSYADVTSSQGRSKQIEQNEDKPCSKCDGVIHDLIKALQCEFCAEWVCLHCSGMPEPVYDAIIDNHIPNFIWTCDRCVNAVPTIKNLASMLQGVKNEQEGSRKQMNELNQRVERLEESIDAKVHAAIDDYREREARKCNVILHNIPEPTAEQADGRKLEDNEQVSDMFRSGLELDQVQIQSIVRLGKRIDGKTRASESHDSRS